MRYNVNLVEPAAAVDWGTFRVEGDLYLRRLDIPDDVAIWLAAKLYLAQWRRWKTGRKWDDRRAHWVMDGAWQQDKNYRKVLDPRTGQMVPPCMEPRICEDCGGYCSWNSTRCRSCWDKVRPRKASTGDDDE